MKLIDSDRTYIDYWQNTGVRKDNYGIRVLDGYCLILRLGSQEPSMFGRPQALPVRIELLPENIRSIISDHLSNLPDSDLRDVLVGKKSFEQALGPRAKIVRMRKDQIRHWSAS